MLNEFQILSSSWYHWLIRCINVKVYENLLSKIISDSLLADRKWFACPYCCLWYFSSWCSGTVTYPYSPSECFTSSWGSQWFADGSAVRKRLWQRCCWHCNGSYKLWFVIMLNFSSFTWLTWRFLYFWCIYFFKLENLLSFEIFLLFKIFYLNSLSSSENLYFSFHPLKLLLFLPYLLLC